MYCSATQNRKDGYTLLTPRISHVKVIACHLPARSSGVRSAEGMLALPSWDISAGLQDLLFFFLVTTLYYDANVIKMSVACTFTTMGHQVSQVTVVLSEAACSLVHSLRHHPVCPMLARLHDRGMRYMTACWHCGYLVLWLFVHISCFLSALTCLHMVSTLFGAQNTVFKLCL